MDANSEVFTMWSFSKKRLSIPGLDKKYYLYHKGGINGQV